MTNPRAYYAYTRSTLQLTMRDRTVLFFSYMFPLIFFIASVRASARRRARVQRRRSS